MSNMTEQDKMQAEDFAMNSLGSMEEWNFSLAQKAAVIDFMQRKLFSPMKLMIEGELIEISSAQVMILEHYFAEFKESCVKNLKCAPVEWIRRTGTDEAISDALKRSYLSPLSTKEGIAFLREKLGIVKCSLAA